MLLGQIIVAKYKIANIYIIDHHFSLQSAYIYQPPIIKV